MKSFDLAPLLAGKTLGTASDSFVVAEWRDVGGTFDPPRLIAPRHIHHSDDEAWYVLEGKLRVEMGDKEVEAPAGAGVMVPRGTPHTYWNPGPQPVRYLLIMTPNIHRSCHAGAESGGAARSLPTARLGSSGIDRAENPSLFLKRVAVIFQSMDGVERHYVTDGSVED
jgi:mannose-6-phosphate isomerase-like protein (cupin superfamily)